MQEVPSAGGGPQGRDRAGDYTPARRIVCAVQWGGGMNIDETLEFIDAYLEATAALPDEHVLHEVEHAAVREEREVEYSAFTLGDLRRLRTDRERQARDAAGRKAKSQRQVDRLLATRGDLTRQNAALRAGSSPPAAVGCEVLRAANARLKAQVNEGHEALRRRNAQIALLERQLAEFARREERHPAPAAHNRALLARLTATGATDPIGRSRAAEHTGEPS